jgi:hypothetical protein
MWILESEASDLTNFDMNTSGVNTATHSQYELRSTKLNVLKIL